MNEVVPLVPDLVKVPELLKITPAPYPPLEKFVSLCAVNVPALLNVEPGLPSNSPVPAQVPAPALFRT